MSDTTSSGSTDSTSSDDWTYPSIASSPAADHSGPVVELCGHRVALREAPTYADTEQICHVIPKGLAQFAQLRLDGVGFDATIDIDGKAIEVHRALLSARIPYFRALLDPSYAEGAAGRASISSANFSEFDGETIARLLDYAYTGHLELTAHNVQTIMECATFLGMNDVVASCGSFMYKRIRYDDAIPLLFFFRAIGYKQKEESLIRWIDLNFVPISFTPEFAELTIGDLLTILQRDSLRVDCEKQVFDAVDRWITVDEEKRRDDGMRLLNCVRWGLVPMSLIDDSIEGAPWIRDKEECAAFVRHKRDTGAKSLHGRLCDDRLQLMFLYAFRTGPGRATATFMCNPDTKIWTSSSTRNGASWEESTVVVGSKMHCIGPTPLVYNAETNQWREGDDLPRYRCKPAAAALAGIIYAAGGVDEGDFPYKSAKMLDTTSAIPDWQRIAPMHKRRHCAVGCALNGKIWVIGGSYCNDLCGDGEVYDPVTDRWTLLAPMTYARWGGAVAVLNGAIYFVGGRSRVKEARGEMEENISPLERYDPATDTWTTLKEAEKATRWPTLYVSQGKLYLFEDVNEEQEDSKSILAVYDPTTDSWERRQYPSIDIGWQVDGFPVPAHQPLLLVDREDQ